MSYLLTYTAEDGVEHEVPMDSLEKAQGLLHYRLMCMEQMNLCEPILTNQDGHIYNPETKEFDDV